jgi:hypothetical protein
LVDHRTPQPPDRPQGTIAEANGRSTPPHGTLPRAVIAIAFIGQANQLGDSYHLFVLTLLPTVFLVGVFTYLRWSIPPSRT